ncbi:MAG: hypothetical protein GOU98_02500, partial [Candidatus Altiarchaeota archaeon]|nr:hypothetical protein [Candidatus Altiarchaeota archaeon]
VLMTVKLPYSDDFIDKSIKKFIPFILTSILLVVSTLFMIDFVDFLYNFNSNALFLLIVPSYLLFKILTFPWIFDRWGVLSIKKAFKQQNENNWLILSGIMFLLIANQIPYLIFFLSAPVSYILADNLEVSLR